MRIYTAASTFTRPNNTTAYGAGDLIANSVNAANVVPLTFVIPQGFLLTNIRVENTDVLASINYIVQLYKYSPTLTGAPIGGDGSIPQPHIANFFLGAISITNVDFSLFSAIDGSIATGPVDPNLLPIIPDDTAGVTGNQIYGLLICNSSYNPFANTKFTVTLIGVD